MQTSYQGVNGKNLRSGESEGGTVGGTATGTAGQQNQRSQPEAEYETDAT